MRTSVSAAATAGGLPGCSPGGLWDSKSFTRRGRSPSPTAKSTASSMPRLLAAQDLGSPKVRVRGIIEDPVRWEEVIRSGPVQPKAFEGDKGTKVSSDPWRAETNAIPESKRRSPRLPSRALSPTPCQERATSRARSPSVTSHSCLLSLSLTRKDAEAFFNCESSPLAGSRSPAPDGDGSPVRRMRSCGAGFGSGALETPQVQTRRTSPAPSASPTSSPLASPGAAPPNVVHAVIPGQSHYSNHGERALLHDRPGHRVQKMWTADGMTGSMRVPSIMEPTSPISHRSPRSLPIKLSDVFPTEKAIPAQVSTKVAEADAAAVAPPVVDNAGAAGNARSPQTEKPPPCTRVDPKNTVKRVTTLPLASSAAATAPREEEEQQQLSTPRARPIPTASSLPDSASNAKGMCKTVKRPAVCGKSPLSPTRTFEDVSAVSTAISQHSVKTPLKTGGSSGSSGSNVSSLAASRSVPSNAQRNHRTSFGGRQWR